MFPGVVEFVRRGCAVSLLTEESASGLGFLRWSTALPSFKEKLGMAIIGVAISRGLGAVISGGKEGAEIREAAS